jgi:hypothetical protein
LSAKDLIIKPIDRNEANNFVRKIHYSGKVDPRSQLHLGIFWNGRLEGVMQFGPSIDKRKTQRLVEGTLWNGFLELNRMAFSEALPKNSESRAIAVAMKLIRKHAPQVKWVISFADATQCGDGTIYRASGFVLTGIKKNQQILELKDGRRISKKALDNVRLDGGRYLSSVVIEEGAKPLDGYQIRYVYFIDPAYRKNLTVPELSFDKIKEFGATMYRGTKRPKEHEPDTIGIRGRCDSDPDAPNLQDEVAE